MRRHDRLALWVGLTLLAPALIAATIGPALAPGDPFAGISLPFRPPSRDAWFGTDDLGRDLLTAIVHGARTSLLTGGVVAVLALGAGLIVGCAAGFGRPAVDDALMRATEFFQVVPRFFLAILVLALFGQSLANLLLVLALTSWGGLARVARAEVLSYRERDFVTAARALGGRPFRIALRHIVPHVAGSLLPMATLTAGGAILTEAGLSYLGLGDPNRMSWGYLLRNAQPFLYRAWWLPVFPGLAIVLTVLGLALVLDQRR